VKSADLATTYFTTDDGSMVVSFDDATTLSVRLTEAQSELAGAFSSGVWEVRAKNGLTLLWDRIAEGQAEMDRAVAV
jgi:hypothetical protein